MDEASFPSYTTTTVMILVLSLEDCLSMRMLVVSILTHTKHTPTQAGHSSHAAASLEPGEQSPLNGPALPASSICVAVKFPSPLPPPKPRPMKRKRRCGITLQPVTSREYTKLRHIGSR